MKTWFQSHRLRRRRSGTNLSLEDFTMADNLLDAALPIQRHQSFGLEDNGNVMSFPASSTHVETGAKLAASQGANRMSIERYLRAPLEDEPASVPAINAALRKQAPPRRTYRSKSIHRQDHSPETSLDATSEGRRTFYTSGSAPDSTGTLFSVVLRPNHNQRSNAHSRMPELPKLNTVALEHVNIQSPEGIVTGRTMDSEKTLVDLPDTNMSGYPSKRSDYRARIEFELAQIQHKARILEEKMQRFTDERENAELLVPRITDEMAHEQIAAKPKLAWIFGDDSVNARSTGRPNSSGSEIVNRVNHIHDRPRTSGTLVEGVSDQLPRRARSSSALNEEVGRSIAESQPASVERRSSRRTRFYCTFCQKKFHSREEWARHEKNIHMPEELWVCCPRTGGSPDRCPFCAETNPTPSHLADHNYLSCQAKPLSERTFDHKDHFLQHISQEHIISPEQKPLRLTELLQAWRHPLPLGNGHQALHCGFCGLEFPTYPERTEHVARHFMAGLDMMSWWSARLSHDVKSSKRPSQSDQRLPHRCCYCQRTYDSLEAARKQHPVCAMWSCSFLPGMQYTIYPSGLRPSLEAVCCYCNETLVKGSGKVKGAVLKEHLDTHNFRKCSQRLYFSAQRFRQHLQENHKINYDGTLFAGWTLLLKSSKQEKPAVFEALDVTEPEPVAIKPEGKKARTMSLAPMMNFMDFSETPLTSAPRKKIRRKQSAQTMPEIPPREVRDSTHFFTRAVTIDLAYGETISPPGAQGILTPEDRRQHKTGSSTASQPVGTVNTGLQFYRRRLDASTRNRLYMRDEGEGPLSKSSQRLFRKLPGSTFGGLVLYSSLAAATPARLTNSVDIYSLH